MNKAENCVNEGMLSSLRKHGTHYSSSSLHSQGKRSDRLCKKFYSVENGRLMIYS